MKRIKSRSNCPINFSLEIVGDAWSLLVMRDIIYFGRKTYNEFLASDEGIARTILADRLAQLQAKGLLVKKHHPSDRRKEIYEVTEAGLELIPLLLDMAEWGAKRVPHQEDLPHAWLQAVREQRHLLIPRIQETVRQGGSIFGNPGLFQEIKRTRHAELF